MGKEISTTKKKKKGGELKVGKTERTSGDRLTRVIFLDLSVRKILRYTSDTMDIFM